MSVLQKQMTGTENQSLNINEASKACGLSPSVLRIWELRYGWPNPKRKANGYRTYSPHLVADLKRIAGLIKQGLPIRQLVVDGLPNWPQDEATPKPKQRRLEATRNLTAPAGRMEKLLREDLVMALETHRSGHIMETLQRCAWQVRQCDELDTCLAPTVVGLAELETLDRHIDNPAPILGQVTNRARQLLHQPAASDGQTVLVVTDDENLPLSLVACLALRGRGLNPVFEATEIGTPVLLVGTTDRPQGAGTTLGRVTALGDDGTFGLGHLLDKKRPLPWQVEVG